MAREGTGIAGAIDYVPLGQTDRPTGCFVCGGRVKMGGHAARCLPPLVVVCSAACSADDRWLRPYAGPSDRPALREDLAVPPTDRTRLQAMRDRLGGKGE
ncbi:hypothetical protein [Roseomonas chloroacetimidivorans]|uniref:hypothetical protein n=1 Tax=Roseomonas chloroacetimidivorans TaxID=1766656 RepID=UPI003C71D885